MPSVYEIIHFYINELKPEFWKVAERLTNIFVVSRNAMYPWAYAQFFLGNYVVQDALDGS